jgi:alkylated DNA nucleotide flippase Atl1
LAVLPAGAWTSYSDLAELIGSHQVPVGQHLANEDVPHPWRVLTSDGTAAPGFRWSDAARRDTPVDLLRAEGVRFDDRGRADMAQRLTAAELADLIGLHRDLPAMTEEETDEGSFWAQLRDAQPSSIVDAVTALVGAWRSAGGEVGFGPAEETGCYLFVRPGRSPDGRRPPWPWAIYPLSGRVEVVFQYLKARPPFDDPVVRDEFRQRCNRIPGVNLPPAKLDVRPSFPLDVLGSHDGRAAAHAVLEWFMTTSAST